MAKNHPFIRDAELIVTDYLDAALHKMAGPLDLARVSSQLYHVLAGFGVFEPHNTTITSNEHDTSPRFNLVT